mgnify:CR=1 FL=1
MELKGLRGSAETRIDDKGRLKVPSIFRSVIQDRHGADVFVTSLTGECVLIYPLTEWVALEQRLLDLPEQHRRRSPLSSVRGVERLYFRQLLSGRDFAISNPVAQQMVNFAYAIGDRATVPMHTVIWRELRVLGSHGMAASRFPQMLTEVASGALRPGRFVTRTIGLAEVPAALAAMSDGSEPGVTIIRP